MKILAIDLAWSGKTGWVLWGRSYGRGEMAAVEEDGTLAPYSESKSRVALGPFAEATSPVYDYGEFQINKKSVRDRVFGIYNQIRQLIIEHESNSGLVIAYEQTDWHQSLSGRDYKKKYAQERRVQRCLGRAEAALLLATGPDHQFLFGTVEPYAIGAREAKQEFGAMRKDAVARLLAGEYPNKFEFRDDLGKDAFLWDLKLQQPISHHISDAMVIASVVWRRLENENRLGA
jgi:hypothetical protein